VGSIAANPSETGSLSSRLLQMLQSAKAEVWVKFLLALVGLGLAFAAALFSTISRDAGNLWTTLILASTSLVMAALVGLITVPYLARRVAVERFREQFDYDVTRAGIVYALVTLVIAIAALNTGNNLLYIVVAAMLAAILVSGYVSAVVLRYLDLDIVRCSAGLSCTIRAAGCRHFRYGCSRPERSGRSPKRLGVGKLRHLPSP
jgi:hypothetical protein